MRSHPIGTGPFKFVEFKPNEWIKLTRNPDYWKKDRPYLDAIEYTIIKEISTRNLAFFAGKFDVTSPFGVTVPTLKDFRSQTPQAICEVTATNVNRTMIVNSGAAPFHNPDLRRAMALSLDRKAFIDIITEGQGDIMGLCCCRRRRACGGCRRRCSNHCPVMIPTCRRTAPRRARSCRSSAMVRLQVKLSTRDIPPIAIRR